MSADNFMLLRRHEDQFVVTMEFASDDEPRPIRQRPDGAFEGGMTRAFDNYADAHEYAHSEWTEYGVEDQTAIDVMGDTLAVLAKLIRLHAAEWTDSWIADMAPTVFTSEEIAVMVAALDGEDKP